MPRPQSQLKRNLNTSVIVRICFLLTCSCAVGCNQGDLDRLERVGRKAKERVVGATRPAQGKLAEGLKSLQPDAGQLSLEKRVTARLKWDIDLVGTKVQVLAKKNVIELRGNVKTREQKKRALELTTSTIGVAKVIDDIRIVPVTASVEGRSRP